MENINVFEKSKRISKFPKSYEPSKLLQLIFHSSHYLVGHPPTHTPGQGRPTTAKNS